MQHELTRKLLVRAGELCGKCVTEVCEAERNWCAKSS